MFALFVLTTWLGVSPAVATPVASPSAAASLEEELDIPCGDDTMTPDIHVYYDDASSLHFAGDGPAFVCFDLMPGEWAVKFYCPRDFMASALIGTSSREYDTLTGNLATFIDFTSKDEAKMALDCKYPWSFRAVLREAT